MNAIPRRVRVDQWTPAEHAIDAAVQAVEKAGADVRLTDAVTLLYEARQAVADYVDQQERRRAVRVTDGLEWAAAGASPSQGVRLDGLKALVEQFKALMTHEVADYGSKRRMCFWCKSTDFYGPVVHRKDCEGAAFHAALSAALEGANNGKA